MRPLERRLRELESVPHPDADDYARLLTLASDMEDEIDRLRDMVQTESTRACELRERLGLSAYYRRVGPDDEDVLAGYDRRCM